MSIRTASIQFIDDGVPHAQEFGDHYFSDIDGLAETRYVFIQQNDLESRWQQAVKKDQTPPFVIAETGFGTGLNFLATWQAFKNFKQTNPNSESYRLHFISTEKFPLALQDLETALSKWLELQPLSQQLIESYPHLTPGCHRLVFENGHVVLDLWLGDVRETLPLIHNTPLGIVDAWYLDGFAPSKNPEMWTNELYQQVARLSKEQATFATFTAAGAVKRGLASHGFTVEKRKGFGRKREMLMGRFTSEKTDRKTHSYFFREKMQVSSDEISIAIVGGGMASANLAYSLTQRGFQVSLFCEDASIAKGASGNPQGGFYPQLNAEANISSQIQALGFNFAKQRYRQLISKGFEFSHSWCGVLQLAFNDAVKDRQKKLIENQTWPESLIYSVNSVRASEIANLDLPYEGLYIADGGWICPPKLVAALFEACNQAGCYSQHMDTKISSIEKCDTGWKLIADRQKFTADVVVFANGEKCMDLNESAHLPFQAVRGQVEAIPTFSPLSNLNTVLCHKGYLTPEFNGTHALGSSYSKNDRETAQRASESESNIAMHLKALEKTNWIEQLKSRQPLSSARAAIRCSLPDHLPVVGSLFSPQIQTEQFSDLYKALPIHRYPSATSHKNLYVFSGLGSRGLTTAPLMAELLTSQIAGEPLPLDSTLLNALNPNRFLVKKLIKREI